MASAASGLDISQTKSPSFLGSSHELVLQPDASKNHLWLMLSIFLSHSLLSLPLRYRNISASHFDVPLCPLFPAQIFHIYLAHSLISLDNSSWRLLLICFPASTRMLLVSENMVQLVELLIAALNLNMSKLKSLSNIVLNNIKIKLH